MKSEISLNNLPVGSVGIVKSLSNSGVSRRRLLDLGLIPNSVVTTERQSPAGNPTAYNIRGAIIALRSEEAKNVIISPLKHS